MKTRQQIVDNAKHARSEIDQLFNDAEYWNNNVRKPGVEPIDPDPEGELARYKKAIDAMLANEIRISEPQ